MKSRYTLFFLAVVLIFSCLCITVTANDSTIDINISETKINQAIIKAIELSSDDYRSGMGYLAELDDLMIGSAIHAYECVDGTFNELNFDVYPIFSDGKIVASAVVYEIDPGRPVAQIDSGNIYQLVVNEPAAILYDKHSCFLYDGDSIEYAYSFTSEICFRDDIECGNVDYINVKLTSVKANTSITPDKQHSSKAQNNLVYTCYVSLVPKESSYPLSCWASANVCIGNYVQNKSYTVTGTYPNWQLQYGVGIETACSLLNSAYSGIGYSDTSFSPTAAVIASNLAYGYPVFIAWDVVSGNKHATVAYSIDVTAGYISMMDPDDGWRICYESSSPYHYSYVAISGVTLNAEGYISKY